jgi:carbamoyl-phosphate synthase large subunit
VPYITTLAGAYNTVKGIAAARNGHGAVKSLQEYHASIEEV